MPLIGFGEELPKSSGNFIRLKNVGEKIQFRILGIAYVEGNHFFFDDGKWDVQPCPRINAQSECAHCEKFFQALKAIPKTEDKAEYNKLRDAAKKTVPGCEAAITYNFPIINRETGLFTIFKATPGIRTKIESDAAVGVKVMDVDFVAVKTAKPGKDKYAVSRVDSADTKPLTPEEQAIKDNYDPKVLVAAVEGTPDDEGSVAIEANTEVLSEPNF